MRWSLWQAWSRRAIPAQNRREKTGPRWERFSRHAQCGDGYWLSCNACGRNPISEGPFEPPDAFRADATARLERLWRATHKLLFDRWPAVKRLSKTLVHHDRIDQAELDQIGR